MSFLRSVSAFLCMAVCLIGCNMDDTDKSVAAKSAPPKVEPKVGISQAIYMGNGDLQFRLSTLESSVPLVLVAVEVRDKTKRPYYTYNPDALRTLPASWFKVTQGGPIKPVDAGLEIPPKTLVEFSLRPNFETKVQKDEYSLQVRDVDGHSFDLPLPLKPTH